jgi:hypothetical protein
MAQPASVALAHRGFATLGELHARPGLDALADKGQGLLETIAKYGSEAALAPLLSDPACQLEYLSGSYPAPLDRPDGSSRPDGMLCGEYEFLQGLRHRREDMLQPVRLAAAVTHQPSMGMALMPLEDEDLKSVCKFTECEVPATELEWDGKEEGRKKRRKQKKNKGEKKEKKHKKDAM